MTNDTYFIYFWLLMEVVYLVCFFASRLNGKAMLPRDRLNLAPALITGVIGLAQAGIGAAQKMKAAKIAAQNKRPVLQDNPYIDEAYNLTASQTLKPVSDAAMQAYQANNDNNLSSSIDAILKSGGSANNIADLYENSQSGLRSLTLATQENKMRNINQFLASGVKPKADENRDKWYLNEYVPFQDTAALSASLSNQGMDNIFKGINTVGGALMEGNKYNTDRGSGGPGMKIASKNPALANTKTREASTGMVALPGQGSNNINPALINQNPQLKPNYNTTPRYNSWSQQWE